MDFDAYEAPELVSLGLAEELVQFSWSGPAVDWIGAHFSCGDDAVACPVGG